MKVVQHQVDVSASGYRIAGFHASGANSNAGDLARGESSGDRLGFCGTAVPHRLYLLSCLASRPAGAAVSGCTSHKGHGFLTQPHPRLVA